ncbi:MAG: ATPase [Planctomycetia bacterium]|nr:ATPase [Planctomycetia bacterium]
MSYFLLADSGSTKIDWILSSTESDQVFQWSSSGINPFHQNENDIKSQIDLALFSESLKIEAFSISNMELNSKLNVSDTKEIAKSEFETKSFQTKYLNQIKDIYFYGAGLTTQEKGKVLRQTFRNLLPQIQTVATFSDLLGAARGLLQKKQGIACILGTGANSCLYDGHQINDNVSAGGYILGDEGSGSWLGKHLLSDFLKRELPDELHSALTEEYQLDVATILENVYRKPFANRYLAQFSKFLSAHFDSEYCHSLVEYGIKVFFERNIMKYPKTSTSLVSATGSIASVFANSFCKTAQKFSFNVETIQKSPIYGLLLFHRTF